jgi:hypothetical protein
MPLANQTTRAASRRIDLPDPSHTGRTETMDRRDDTQKISSSYCLSDGGATDNPRRAAFPGCRFAGLSSHAFFVPRGPTSQSSLSLRHYSSSAYSAYSAVLLSLPTPRPNAPNVRQSACAT